MLYVNGELYKGGVGCENYNPGPILYYETDHSYLAMSDEAATCFAEQISKTPLGKYTLNKKHWNSLFHVQEEITTSSIAKTMPIFRDKLGENKPLRFDFSYENMDIKFGQEGCNICITLDLGVQAMYDWDAYEY